MRRYVLFRAIAVIPVAFGMVLMVFLLLNVLPVDPIQVMITQSGGGQVPSGTATEEMIASIRAELGLDRPLVVQFLSYIGNALTGDLGASFRNNQPVAEMLAEQYPYTFRLALAGMSVTIVLGLTLGVLAGLFPGSVLDRALVFVATLGISAPTFWVGLMLIWVFAILFPVFPVLGSGSLKAIVLPAITLGLPGAAIVARLTRSNLAEVMRQDYTLVARAKGLSGWIVVARHAMPNVLAPVLTVIGLQFGNLITGTVIVETVFSRPGIGRLGVDAILNSDYPIVQGFTLALAASYVFLNLAVDILQMLLDPRVTR